MLRRRLLGGEEDEELAKRKARATRFNVPLVEVKKSQKLHNLGVPAKSATFVQSPQVRIPNMLRLYPELIRSRKSIS